MPGARGCCRMSYTVATVWFLRVKGSERWKFTGRQGQLRSSLA